MILKLFGSIRRSLMLVALLALLPGLAIILHAGLEQRRAAIAEVESELLQFVASVAEIQVKLTSQARFILTTLAAMPEFARHDAAHCNEVVGRLFKQMPGLVNILATNERGDLFASALPFQGVNLSDRKHFREAMATGRFSAGEYIVSRTAQEPAFPFALPVAGPDGKVVGTLITAQRLTAYAGLLERLPAPRGAFLGITDHAGVRLFYWPPRETNLPGRPIRPDVWQAISGPREEGIVVADGSDGMRRIFAWKQLRLEPGDRPYMYMVVGIPEHLAYAGADADTRRNLVLLALAAALALGAAWLVGELFISRNLARIAANADSIAAGQLAVRVEPIPVVAELSRVARAFNSMAANLIRREHERDEAEAALRLSEDALRRSLAEKETLLKEVHHRVKNNLQVVVSLMSLQATESNDERLNDALERLRGRVRAMALIHERLYAGGDLSAVDMGEYLSMLATSIGAVFSPRGGIELRVETERVLLDIDRAIPCGLLLNELISNAYKHAFGADGAGVIRVVARPLEGGVEMIVEDDGAGLPPDFEARNSLGMLLVRTLVGQLKARIEIGQGPGARFRIVLPPQSEES